MIYEIKPDFHADFNGVGLTCDNNAQNEKSYFLQITVFCVDFGQNWLLLKKPALSKRPFTLVSKGVTIACICCHLQLLNRPATQV